MAQVEAETVFVVEHLSGRCKAKARSRPLRPKPEDTIMSIPRSGRRICRAPSGIVQCSMMGGRRSSAPFGVAEVSDEDM